MRRRPAAGQQHFRRRGIALAADDPDLQQQIGTMLYDYSSNALTEGYFGGTSQYYFNQSLAWFGASLVSGHFRNLYAEE